MAFPRSTLVLPLAMLAACSSPGTASDPKVIAPAFPEAGESRCDASKVASMVGQRADEATIERARAQSGAKGARVIMPGMAVTMDHRPERLSVEVAEDGTIRSLRCG
jgi:hypothetical protein